MNAPNDFKQGLQAFIEEIDARDPGYLQSFPIALPLADTNRRFCEGDPDPLIDALMRSLHSPTAPEDAPVDVEEVLRLDYVPLATDETKIFHVRQRGTHPLLLLNALGVPLKVWRTLLAGNHNYRLIVPQLSCCDLLAGGMSNDRSARDHAIELAKAVGRLECPTVDVLAWCNGGRIGIELAKLLPERVGHLILLSPTFRGSADDDLASPYENKLEQLFSTLRKTPKLAAPLATVFRKINDIPDWQALPGGPHVRAKRLFGLPRQEFAGDLVAPMVQPESLMRYAERTHKDEVLSASNSDSLAHLRISLIQGDCDAVVSNAQAKKWLRDRHVRFSAYEISAAGHYIHDLQYHYMIPLLDRLLLGREGKHLPARVRIIDGD